MNRRHFIYSLLLAPLSVSLASTSKAARKSPLRGPVGLGIPAFDEIKNGFCPGELTLIYGRPSVGKSAFGLALVQNTAFTEGRRVVVFSIERSREDYEKRLYVQSDLLYESRVQPIVFDSPRQSPESILQHLRSELAPGPIDLVVIDYLQLLGSSSPSLNRSDECLSILLRLKEQARELKIPFVVLSQINRPPAGRADRRPLLIDVPKGVESIADSIVLLHRSYGADGNRRNRKLELNISKNRTGSSGRTELLLPFV